MKLKNPVLLAQIGAPHGIKGEVRVKSFTGDPLALGDYGALYSVDGRKFRIKRLRPAKTVLVVKFEGANSRDEAEALNRLELYVDRSMLPDDIEEDEFYVTDLIGMNIIDEAGEQIGKVLTVSDFGAGDLLEISPAAGSDGKSWYLEFTRQNVPEVNMSDRILTIRIPQEVSERD